MRRLLYRRTWLRRPSGVWTITALVLGVVLVAAGAVGLYGHFQTPGSQWTIGLAAATPFLTAAGLLGAVFVALSRQWLALLVAAVLAVWAAALQAPLFFGADAPAKSVHIHVLSFNMRIGGADAASIVRVARAKHVDLLMLEELTPDALARVEAAGIDRRFPYRIATPGPYGVGTGLWSRYPLTETRPLAIYTFRFISATAQVPGLAGPLAIAAIHVAGPVPVTGGWLDDMRHLPAELRRVAGTGRSVIVAGDFNATRDVVQFRDLLATGYEDADAQSGAGYVFTYPADRSYPPLIGIDHVLTRHAVATSFDSLSLPGSDHRAVLSTVAVPTG